MCICLLSDEVRTDFIMDKGEPSLVPEWLRSSGHASGGGSSNHLLISSSSHSGILESYSILLIVCLLFVLSE